MCSAKSDEERARTGRPCYPRVPAASLARCSAVSSGQVVWPSSAQSAAAAANEPGAVSSLYSKPRAQRQSFTGDAPAALHTLARFYDERQAAAAGAARP